MTTIPEVRRHTWRHRATLGGAALLTAAGITALTPMAAHAATGVDSWDSLVAAVNLGGPVDVALTANIDSGGNSLVLLPGEALTIDLAGQRLTADAACPGCAGIQTTAASLTINDSVGTGFLTAVGNGPVGGAVGAGAGIGGHGGSFSSGIAAADGGNLTITGGTINATGGAAGTGAAGIGGGDAVGNNGGSGGSTTITGGTVSATGGPNAAGIGSSRSGAGGSTTITGGTVNATGGQHGAGIGGAVDGDGGSTTITGGTVNATGGLQAAAIGNVVGLAGGGGTLTIGTGADVTAVAGNFSSAAVGSNGTSPYGSVTNAGHLRIDGNQTVYSPITNTATGVITLNGTMLGAGTVTNDGTILLVPGNGSVRAGTPVTDHDYAVSYDTTAVPPPTAAPAAQTVYAATFNDAAVTLPTLPSGYAWRSAQTGGSAVTDTTDLPTLFGENTLPNEPAYGATAVTLYAEPIATTHTVTFDPNDGEAATPVSVNDGGTVTEPADPTRATYVFGGWFTAGGTAYNPTTPVTSDLTLYAHWTAIAPCGTGIQMTDGLTAGSATRGVRNQNGTWSYAVTVRNCTTSTLTNLKVQGGTSGWDHVASTSPSTGTVSVKSAKPGQGQVITWSGFTLASGSAAQITVTVAGTITKTSACGSTLPLAGNSSATGTVGKKSYSATLTKIPTITVSC